MSDLRLWIEHKDTYTYPDVMVVWGGLKFVAGRTDTITNPQIIIKVLSESTVGYDRSDKFQAYWTLDSLAECILVDPYRLRVEYFRRLNEKEGRLLVLTKADERLKREAIAVEMPLNQIYRNVSWYNAQ